MATFGGIDTWVNVAGLTVYGPLREISQDDHERLIRTNFWGTVNGALVAAEHLRARGGALINVGSIASDLAFPFQGLYAASKHAVKGFTDTLRMELIAEGAPVSVTLVKPASIDTPLPARARNYMDREPMLPPPVYPPEEVARAILHAAEHPVRDIVVGGGGKLFTAGKEFAPGAFDQLAPAIIAMQKRKDPPREPQGALHSPRSAGRERGDQPDTSSAPAPTRGRASTRWPRRRWDRRGGGARGSGDGWAAATVIISRNGPSRITAHVPSPCGEEIAPSCWPRAALLLENFKSNADSASSGGGMTTPRDAHRAGGGATGGLIVGGGGRLDLLDGGRVRLRAGTGRAGARRHLGFGVRAARGSVAGLVAAFGTVAAVCGSAGFASAGFASATFASAGRLASDFGPLSVAVPLRPACFSVPAASAGLPPSVLPEGFETAVACCGGVAAAAWRARAASRRRPVPGTGWPACRFGRGGCRAASCAAARPTESAKAPMPAARSRAREDEVIGRSPEPDRLSGRSRPL